MEYTIKRSGRRSVGLEVGRDGAVLVRAPQRMRARDIDAFVARHAGWIEQARARQEKRAARPEPTAAELETMKRRAGAAIPPRVEHYAAVMGLTPAAVKITAAKTRFGSCSAKDSLCFSCRLIAYPPEAVDYVVVHELAHITHKNHGREFYALVASVLPDWRERRGMLKEGG